MLNAIIGSVLSAFSEYARQKADLAKQKAEFQAILAVQRAGEIAQIRDATGASDADAATACAVAATLTDAPQWYTHAEGFHIVNPQPASSKIDHLQMYRMGLITVEQLLSAFVRPKV